MSYVAHRMRRVDYQELFALTWCRDRADLIEYCVESYAVAPGARVLLTDDGRPVAAYLAQENRPNVLTLGMFATDHFPLVAKPFTRAVIREILDPARERGVRRIEALSIASNTESHKWLRLLGLSLEATHKCYGRDGEAFCHFAWVAQC